MLPLGIVFFPIVRAPQQTNAQYLRTHTPRQQRIYNSLSHATDFLE